MSLKRTLSTLAGRRLKGAIACLVTAVAASATVAAWAASSPPASSAQAPTWISITPPLVAIAVALIWRAIVPALFAGTWVGAWAINGTDIPGLWVGLSQTFEVHVLGAVADPDRASIVLFSMMIGGMVGICLENGGMNGLARHLTRFASDRRRAQSSTAGLGLFIFFDDYANLLIVGNVMRPITDRFKVSREKLAYLVDSTAAPLAAVGFMTTWIGFEVGVIEQSLRALGQDDVQPYGVFLRSLAHSYYPWLALLLVMVVAVSGRDFGAMARAEAAAARGGPAPATKSSTPAGGPSGPSPPSKDLDQAPAWLALLPISVMVLVMLASLSATGEGTTLWRRIATADPFVSLLRGSLFGALTAVAVTLAARRLSLEETMRAWYRGAESLLMGLITLVLAWALADTTEVLGTAAYLGTWIDGTVPLALLPLIVFLMAAAVALATGSAWGTMGLLMPLAIPLLWQQASLVPGVRAEEIIAATVAAVLGGAVFGDHCSPISDTTILSSLASECDHIAHVQTQMPYALLVAGSATLFGILPTSLGLPPLASLLLAAAAMVLIFFAVSKPLPLPSPSVQPQRESL